MGERPNRRGKQTNRANQAIPAGPAVHRYPRTARVNEVIRQVLAEELERLADHDDRLRLITITGVQVDGDLRHATVWFSSLPDATRAALGELRIRLQAAIGRQVRMKRTPLLAFEADPAVSSGARVEEILRTIDHDAPRDPGGGIIEDSE